MTAMPHEPTSHAASISSDKLEPSPSAVPPPVKSAPAEIRLSIPLPAPESLIVGLLLLVAVVFNLYQLYPEVAIKVPWLNDGVLHLINLQRTVDALSAGQDPTDNWLGIISLGYPLFHHYQHLSYLLTAIVCLPLRNAISPADMLRWTTYLLLSFFPLAIYWSMRRFGFTRIPSALAGLVASLISTNGLYGLEYGSYVWRGYGLYTQLWGMVLLPMALAQCYRTLRDGRGYFWSVALVAATVMSHVVLGYVALGSVVLLIFLGVGSQKAKGPDGDGFWRRAKRLALLLVLVALVTSYFLVPFLQDSAYMNRSVWEKQDKYDSYGYEWVLGTLLKGDLFDYGRFAALTLLAGIGLVVCRWRWRDERYRIPVVLTVFWLLLYFGRPTWGVLLNLLPMSRDLQLHRLIAGVHLGGIYLMGLGLALPWSWALSQRDKRYLLAVAALTALVLFPVYRERVTYLAQNARWMADQQTAFQAEEKDISELIATLKKLPPGRVYAGLAAKWGKDYKVGSVPMYALLNAAGLDTLGYLYHALSLNADVEVLFDDARQEQYNLFNVRYVVVPVDWTVPTFYKPLGDYGRHRLYQIETTGYFDLVGSDQPFAGSKSDVFPAASSWLASDLVGAKQHPSVFLGLTGNAQLYPLSQAIQIISQIKAAPVPDRGRILSEAVESNAYQAEVQVTRESLLMLKATYHPNWHAYVDGAQVSTVMLMPSYIGVKVTPGTHSVRLEYQPGPLRPILQVAGVLMLILVGLLELRPKWLARIMGRLELQYPAIPGKQWLMHAASWRPFQVAKERIRPPLPYLAGVAVIVLLAGLPLWQLKLMSGHDSLAYLPRYVEFYEGLRAGQLFPRWAPDLGAGYGEPTFNFNPPAIYYLTCLFHSVGPSFIASENLACFALLLLAGFGMYLLAGEFFGPRGGLVSAVAYLFAPYLLVTLYVRHALADFSAFAFIPLAFWGLYRFAQGGRSLFLVIGALSLALMFLSSSSVALFAFPALVLFLGWLAWSGRSWHTLVRGIWCLGLGLGLSAFFLIPALAETRFVHISRRAERFDFHDHFLYLLQLIYSPWGYGLSVPGPQDGMSFAIGPVHLLLAGAALLLLQKVRSASRQSGLLASFFLFLLVLAVFFTVDASRFLWERLPVLQPLQFPWRFLSLVSVSTAFLCGFPFLLFLPRQDRLAKSLMGIMILGLFLFGFPNARPEKYLETTDAQYSPQNIVAGRIPATGREFEPIWVSEFPQAPAQEPLTFLQGQGRILANQLTPVTREFAVEITQAARLRLNTFYFPGWTLYVDGAQRPVEYGNPQGVIEFSLEQGQHGVKFVFADTPVRLWSSRLSWLALFLLVFSPWIKTLVEQGRKMLSAGPFAVSVTSQVAAWRSSRSTTRSKDETAAS